MGYDREATTAPAAAPPARFEVNNIAVICSAAPDAVYCTGTIKSVFWGSGLNTRVVAIVIDDMEDGNPSKNNSFPENGINLFKQCTRLAKRSNS
jgi:hypothetical protein